MDRSEWLAGLKPGDVVAVESNRGVEFPRVARISSDGLIVVPWGRGERHFHASGQEDADTPAARLLTPEEGERIAELREGLLRQLRYTEWRDLPLETLRRVVAALEETP